MDEQTGGDEAVEGPDESGIIDHDAEGRAILPEFKKKVSNEPPENHPKWGQTYAKLKATQRETESLKQEKEQLRKEREEATNKAISLEAALAAVKAVRGGSVSEEKSRVDILKSELSTLSNEKTAALTEGDYKAVVALDEKILDLRDAINEEKLRPQFERVEKNEEEVRARELKNAGATFANSTPWFNSNNKDYNPMMAKAAMQIEKELWYEPEWKSKSLTEQLSEVKRRVEEGFNYSPNARRFPSVGSIDRGGKTGSVNVNISPAEREEALRTLGSFIGTVFKNETEALTAWKRERDNLAKIRSERYNFGGGR